MNLLGEAKFRQSWRCRRVWNIKTAGGVLQLGTISKEQEARRSKVAGGIVKFLKLSRSERSSSSLSNEGTGRDASRAS